MAISVPVSQARSELPKILGMIQDGEEVTLTRHGRPVAVIVRPDTLRVRRTREVDAIARELAESMISAASIPIDDAPLVDAVSGNDLLRTLAENRTDRNAQ